MQFPSASDTFPEKIEIDAENLAKCRANGEHFWAPDVVKIGNKWMMYVTCYTSLTSNSIVALESTIISHGMPYPQNVQTALKVEQIIRDNGCDLGVEGYEIHGRILVHHMNPVTIDDLLHDREYLLDPEFLISTIHNTHNAIHYGDENLLILPPVERTRHDTCPWRRI